MSKSNDEQKCISLFEKKIIRSKREDRHNITKSTCNDESGGRDLDISKNLGTETDYGNPERIIDSFCDDRFGPCIVYVTSWGNELWPGDY